LVLIFFRQTPPAEVRNVSVVASSALHSNGPMLSVDVQPNATAPSKMMLATSEPGAFQLSSAAPASAPFNDAQARPKVTRSSVSLQARPRSLPANSKAEQPPHGSAPKAREEVLFDGRQ
jgi:hypothetical protein